MSVDEIVIAILLPVGLFIAGTAVTMLGIYWCHYPNGQRKRRDGH